MKKLFYLLFAAILFTACSNDPIEVSNPEKETTTEILNIAAKDTSCAKVVILSETLYVVENNLVTKKIENTTGALWTVTLFLIVTFGVLVYVNIIKD